MRPSQPTTRNGWFCYLCHDTLLQHDLLPESSMETLVRENQQLQAELRNIRATAEQKAEPPATPKQLDFFKWMTVNVLLTSRLCLRWQSFAGILRPF